MSVTRVRRLEKNIARACAHERSEHLVHIDVADMWAFIIAPADMHTHIRRVDIAKRVVQRLDMHLGDSDKLIIAKVFKQHMARQREVRAVELKIETGTDDGFIFLLHRIGKRREIGFAGLVMLVLQEQRNHPGRRCIHESPFCAMGFHAGFQVCDVGHQFLLPLGTDLARAHRAGILRRAAGISEPLEEAREHLQIARSVPRAVTGEACVAILDVGGVRNLRGLAIRHDIDPGIDLAAHGFRTGAGHAGVETLLIEGFLSFTGKDEVDHVLCSWKRADMAGQYTVH